jgi:hypothetical protein
MTLQSDFLASLEYLHPQQVVDLFRAENRPRGSRRWTITNEIKPVDLYCYLCARFGPPNGIQNWLRADHSDNLVHWNWTFRHGRGVIDFQGMNFRTDVWLIGPLDVDSRDCDAFIRQVKEDFTVFGAGISKCRRSLEHWIEFVNPYQRLRRSVSKLVEELKSLQLDRLDELPNPVDEEDRETARQRWDDAVTRCTRGFGLCFGIRSMLPIMAEAFVNLLLYVLMRPELRADSRLKENAFRQHIDVRVKSLFLNCTGFKQPIDYSSQACGRYHCVVNERNDLLHGNVDPKKLQFNEVYFSGTVPVFTEYRSMWQRSLGMEREAVGVDKVFEELGIIDDFIAYVLSCLDDKLRPKIEYMLSRLELGLNTSNERVGVLFSGQLVDSKCGPATAEGEAKT